MEKGEPSCTGGIATMKNSMDISLKTRTKATISLNNPTPGYISEKTIIERDTYTLVFTAALFTMAAT